MNFSSPLKLLFLSLLITIISSTDHITTSSAKPTNKLINEICPKTKNPKQCFSIVRGNIQTRFAATLHSLGEGCLDIAIAQANSTVKLIEVSVNQSQANPLMKKKYQNCLRNYNSSLKQLREGKAMVAEYKFGSAVKSLQDAVTVPGACQKEMGAKSGALKLASLMSDNSFDVAFVVVKELESKYHSI